MANIGTQVCGEVTITALLSATRSCSAVVTRRLEQSRRAFRPRPAQFFSERRNGTKCGACGSRGPECDSDRLTLLRQLEMLYYYIVMSKDKCPRRRRIPAWSTSIGQGAWARASDDISGFLARIPRGGLNGGRHAAAEETAPLFSAALNNSYSGNRPRLFKHVPSDRHPG